MPGRLVTQGAEHFVRMIGGILWCFFIFSLWKKTPWNLPKRPVLGLTFSLGVQNSNGNNSGVDVQATKRDPGNPRVG